MKRGCINGHLLRHSSVALPFCINSQQVQGVHWSFSNPGNHTKQGKVQETNIKIKISKKDKTETNIF